VPHSPINLSMRWRVRICTFAHGAERVIPCVLGRLYGGTMSMTEKEGGKLPYEVPTVTVLGTLESITRTDTDGSHFDANFQIGDLIPPNIAS